MKKLILLIVLACSGCGHNPFSPSTEPSDTVSYRVIGNSIVSSVLIDYSTPSSGVVSLVVGLVTPFTSGPIAGYNQFVETKPALTLTIISTGCGEAQILINAVVVEHKTLCGPGTITVKH